MDQILTQYGVKYEDLNPTEKETLNEMVRSLKQNILTVEGIKDYIVTMKESVEEELTKVGHESKQDLFLKARLRNYLLLLAVITSPEKAKKRIEQALKGLTV